MKTTMKTLMLSSVLAFALPLSVFAGGGDHGGGGVEVDIDNSAEAAAEAAALAAAKANASNGNQTMIVKDRLQAPGLSVGGDCSAGVSFPGFAAVGIPQFCKGLKAFEAFDNAGRGGNWSPNKVSVFMDAAARNMGYKITGYVNAQGEAVNADGSAVVSASAAVSTSGKAAMKPATGQMMSYNGDWKDLGPKARAAITGCQTYWNNKPIEGCSY